MEIDAFLDSPAGITWVIASKRERYRLLVRAVLAKWAAPQQEAQEPTAYVHVPHYPVEGKVRPVVSFEKYQQDYDDGIYSTRIPLYTAPQPAPAPLSEREAFEAWFRREYHSRLDRNMPDKSYNDPIAHTMWAAWQARAALASQGGK